MRLTLTNADDTLTLYGVSRVEVGQVTLVSFENDDAYFVAKERANWPVWDEAGRMLEVTVKDAAVIANFRRWTNYRLEESK